MKEFRTIIDAYNGWKKDRLKMVLLTVVQIDELSFRRVGGRMVVNERGQWASGLGQGRFPAEVWTRWSSRLFKSEGEVLAIQEDSFGAALGVVGPMRLLLQPTASAATADLLAAWQRVLAGGDSFVQTRILESEIHKELGTTSLVRLEESPGDPLFELEEVVQKIEEVKYRRRTKVLETQNPRRKYVIEYLRPEPRLILVGNNFDILSMATLGRQLGWRVGVVAHEPVLLESIREQVWETYAFEEIEQLPIHPLTGIIQVTHDYQWDLEVLPRLLQLKVPYLGILGPRKRFENLDRDMQKRGHAPLTTYAHLHGPVGLDIGAETPEEIALAALAEMMAVLRMRSGDRLKSRRGPIHRR